MKQIISAIIIVLALISSAYAIASDYEIYFYHNDHLGSPATVTNTEGLPVWRADYDPFGETVNEEGDSRIKYNSKEEDSTGLLYYGARYYNPRTGRFITADTVKGELTDTQSQNRYVYVKNNPIKYIDLTGNQAEESYSAEGRSFRLNKGEYPIKVLNEEFGLTEKQMMNYGSWLRADPDATGTFEPASRGEEGAILVPFFGEGNEPMFKLKPNVELEMTKLPPARGKSRSYPKFIAYEGYSHYTDFKIVGGKYGGGKYVYGYPEGNKDAKGIYFVPYESMKGSVGTYNLVKKTEDYDSGWFKNALPISSFKSESEILEFKRLLRRIDEYYK